MYENDILNCILNTSWAAAKGIKPIEQCPGIMFLYLWQRFCCDPSCLELIFQYQILSLLLQGKQIQSCILKQLCHAIAACCKMLKDVLKPKNNDEVNLLDCVTARDYNQGILKNNEAVYLLKTVLLCETTYCLLVWRMARMEMDAFLTIKPIFFKFSHIILKPWPEMYYGWLFLQKKINWYNVSFSYISRMFRQE